MGDNNSVLALDALRDMYALAIHNIKSSRKRQENQFPTCALEFHFRDNVLVRNHIRDVWDLRCDVDPCVVHVMGQQLRLAYDSSNICQVYVQGVKVTYPVDELIKC